MKKNSEAHSRNKALTATTLGILFVSTASIFIRLSQNEASAIVIGASRLLIACLILVPIALIRNRAELFSLSRSELLQGSLSGLFLALHFASWITSMQYTSIASSVVLVTTTPLWVALLSPVVLKEPVRKSVLIGLIISLTGTIIVSIADACSFINGSWQCMFQFFSKDTLWGNFLALFGAWMAAGYFLMGRQLRKKLTTVPYAAFVYSVAALILLSIVVIRREPVFSYSGTTYIWLLALGLFPQLLGHSLLNWALKYVSAAYVSLMLLGEPIGTIILAFLFLKETPTPVEGVGAILIMIGIMVGSVSGS